jgi:hypothetical protein
LRAERLLELDSPRHRLYQVIVLGTAALSVLYFARLDTSTRPPAPGATERRRGAWQAIGLGLWALLAGGIPFWATNLPMRLVFPWDRFFMAMMPGVCLLWAGLLELLPGRALKALLLGVVVALSAGYHVRLAEDYRDEWQAQKALFWQLAWRIPQLEPGTALLTLEMPLKLYTDNSLSAPLNWMYAPESKSSRMDYILYDMRLRTGDEVASLDQGQPIQGGYRAAYFNGSTSQALTLFYPPEGCIKILDPAYDAALPLRPRLLRAMQLSDTSNILTGAEDAARPPESVFGPEPPHDWCYYFEQAELSRQLGDWEGVVALGDQAFQAGYGQWNPDELPEIARLPHAAELLPFIEGAAHGGDWQQALALTRRSLGLTTSIQPALCAAWQRISLVIPATPEQQAVQASAQAELGCPAP